MHMAATSGADTPVGKERAPDRSMMRFAGPLFRAIAGRRTEVLARQDTVASQQRTLLQLVRKAANTKFGRDHGFAGIASVADYQARVPLRRYDDFWREYWQASFPTARDCTWPGLAR